MTPLARTAGHALALTAVAIALAAGAQGMRPHGGGLMPWIFALVIAAAIGGVFLFVLWVVRPPETSAGERSPGERSPGERPRAAQQHR